MIVHPPPPAAALRQEQRSSTSSSHSRHSSLQSTSSSSSTASHIIPGALGPQMPMPPLTSDGAQTHRYPSHLVPHPHFIYQRSPLSSVEYQTVPPSFAPMGTPIPDQNRYPSQDQPFQSDMQGKTMSIHPHGAMYQQDPFSHHLQSNTAQSSDGHAHSASSTPSFNPSALPFAPGANQDLSINPNFNPTTRFPALTSIAPIPYQYPTQHPFQADLHLHQQSDPTSMPGWSWYPTSIPSHMTFPNGTLDTPPLTATSAYSAFDQASSLIPVPVPVPGDGPNMTELADISISTNGSGQGKKQHPPISPSIPSSVADSASSPAGSDVSSFSQTNNRSRNRKISTTRVQMNRKQGRKGKKGKGRKGIGKVTGKGKVAHEVKQVKSGLGTGSGPRNHPKRGACHRSHAQVKEVADGGLEGGNGGMNVGEGTGRMEDEDEDQDEDEDEDEDDVAEVNIGTDTGNIYSPQHHHFSSSHTHTHTLIDPETEPPPYVRTHLKNITNILPLIQAPEGCELQVCNLLILIPPEISGLPRILSIGREWIDTLGGDECEDTLMRIQPVELSTFEQYTCRLCRKTYNGKNARSVARRHLQDRHGVPLSLQQRRSRWDRGERPKDKADALERDKASKREHARRRRANERLQKQAAKAAWEQQAAEALVDSEAAHGDENENDNGHQVPSSGCRVAPAASAAVVSPSHDSEVDSGASSCDTPDISAMQVRQIWVPTQSGEGTTSASSGLSGQSSALIPIQHRLAFHPSFDPATAPTMDQVSMLPIQLDPRLPHANYPYPHQTYSQQHQDGSIATDPPMTASIAGPQLERLFELVAAGCPTLHPTKRQRSADDDEAAAEGLIDLYSSPIKPFRSERERVQTGEGEGTGPISGKKVKVKGRPTPLRRITLASSTSRSISQEVFRPATASGMLSGDVSSNGMDMEFQMDLAPVSAPIPLQATNGTPHTHDVYGSTPWEMTTFDPSMFVWPEHLVSEGDQRQPTPSSGSFMPHVSQNDRDDVGAHHIHATAPAAAAVDAPPHPHPAHPVRPYPFARGRAEIGRSLSFSQAVAQSPAGMDDDDLFSSTTKGTPMSLVRDGQSSSGVMSRAGIGMGTNRQRVQGRTQSMGGIFSDGSPVPKGRKAIKIGETGVSVSSRTLSFAETSLSGQNGADGETQLHFSRSAMEGEKARKEVEVRNGRGIEEIVSGEGTTPAVKNVSERTTTFKTPLRQRDANRASQVPIFRGRSDHEGINEKGHIGDGIGKDGNGQEKSGFASLASGQTLHQLATPVPASRIGSSNANNSSSAAFTPAPLGAPFSVSKQWRDMSSPAQYGIAAELNLVPDWEYGRACETPGVRGIVGVETPMTGR